MEQEYASTESLIAKELVLRFVYGAATGSAGSQEGIVDEFSSGSPRVVAHAVLGLAGWAWVVLQVCEVRPRSCSSAWESSRS